MNGEHNRHPDAVLLPPRHEIALSEDAAALRQWHGQAYDLEDQVQAQIKSNQVAEIVNPEWLKRAAGALAVAQMAMKRIERRLIELGEDPPLTRNGYERNEIRKLRGQVRALKAEIRGLRDESTTIQADGDGFVDYRPHDGGPCPYRPDQLVDVQFDDGRVELKAKAGFWMNRGELRDGMWSSLYAGHRIIRHRLAANPFHTAGLD